MNGDMDKDLCACGCGEYLPAGKRYGARYVNATHRQRAYMARERLGQDKMYRKVDENHVIYSVDKSKITDRTCTNCEYIGVILTASKTSGRNTYYCPNCDHLMRPRS